MKYRLLLRRLSISAPRMTVRSQFSWPLRMLGGALVLGLAAAVALWAFDEGRRLTGTHSGDLKTANAQLREQLSKVTAERDKLSTTADTAESQLKIERTAQTKLAEQVKALESETTKLKEDLAFFESLLPATGKQAGIAIRSAKISADAANPGQIRYRMLVMQAGGKAFQELPNFSGQLQLQVSLVQAGKPVQMNLPDAQANPEQAKNWQLDFKQYQRAEGVFTVPAGAQVKSVQVRVLQGGQVRATQTVNL